MENWQSTVTTLFLLFFLLLHRSRASVVTSSWLCTLLRSQCTPLASSRPPRNCTPHISRTSGLPARPDLRSRHHDKSITAPEHTIPQLKTRTVQQPCRHRASAHHSDQFLSHAAPQPCRPRRTARLLPASKLPHTVPRPRPHPTHLLSTHDVHPTHAVRQQQVSKAAKHVASAPSRAVLETSVSKLDLENTHSSPPNGRKSNRHTSPEQSPSTEHSI